MTKEYLHLPQHPINYSLVPLDHLTSAVENAVCTALRQKQEEALLEKFLSPKETQNLFQPRVSLVTLDSWADKGYLKKHHIGGRTYYRYSEVIAAVQTIKKYNRKAA